MRGLRLECYDAPTGHAPRWWAELGDDRTECSQVCIARDHVVAVTAARPTRGGGRVEIAIHVCDRSTGKLAQEPLIPAIEFDQTPRVLLLPSGTLVLQSGSLILGLAGD